MAGPAIKRGGGVKERAIKEKRTFLVSYIWIFFIWKARSSIQSPEFHKKLQISIQCPEFYTIPGDFF